MNTKPMQKERDEFKDYTTNRIRRIEEKCDILVDMMEDFYKMMNVNNAVSRLGMNIKRYKELRR